MNGKACPDHGPIDWPYTGLACPACGAALAAYDNLVELALGLPPSPPRAGRAVDPKPSVGRTVRYVLPAGCVRPAVVTRVLTDYAGTHVYGVNLHVLADAADRQPGGARYDETPAGVSYDATRTPGTWHWPDRD